MSEIIDIQKSIQGYIQAIAKHCNNLDKNALDKAVALSEYDKVLAITIMELRMSKAKELNGATIKDPPATLSEKIAKGLCWQEKLALEVAESAYKSTVIKIQAAQACLNAKQSVFRHMENEIR